MTASRATLHGSLTPLRENGSVEAVPKRDTDAPVHGTASRSAPEPGTSRPNQIPDWSSRRTVDSRRAAACAEEQAPVTDEAARWGSSWRLVMRTRFWNRFHFEYGTDSTLQNGASFPCFKHGISVSVAEGNCARRKGEDGTGRVKRIPFLATVHDSHVPTRSCPPCLRSTLSLASMPAVPTRYSSQSATGVRRESIGRGPAPIHTGPALNNRPGSWPRWSGKPSSRTGPSTAYRCVQGWPAPGVPRSRRRSPPTSAGSLQTMRVPST